MYSTVCLLLLCCVTHSTMQHNNTSFMNSGIDYSVRSTIHPYKDNHVIRHGTTPSYNIYNKKQQSRNNPNKAIIFIQAIISIYCSHYQNSKTMIIFLLYSFLSKSTSVVYDAPATNEYFRSEFNGSITNSYLSHIYYPLSENFGEESTHCCMAL
eukprot:386573_1